MDIRMHSSKETAVRKRKLTEGTSGSEDDDNSKVPKMDGRDQTKKQNHSEIEKRRRDKMNKYITELSSLVPMCNAMSRKLDKLTVLRMAVQHMKTLRGSINSYVEGHYKPAFLSDEELKHLILQAAEGFLFVVSCDRGRILFVSESVSNVLNYAQGDLLGQSWFDILHPKDIAKVKEQLSSSDLSPKERLIDAKTMLPVKSDIPQSQIRLCPGARRSFFCRMKYKSTPVKEETDLSNVFHKRRKSQSTDRRYCVIHCTGYLKSWAPANLSIEEENEGESDCNLSCLVAIGQVQQELLNPGPSVSSIELRPMEFNSRHSMDGKFLFVDQRATLILGYLPQELLGTSCYEYVHQNDIVHIADTQRQVLQTKETVTTQVYKFRTKEGSFRHLQSRWKIFRNPWTRDLEYIVSVNTLVPDSDYNINEGPNTMSDELNCNSNSLDTVLSFLPCTENVGESSRIFGTRVGAGKIGRQIADEVLEMQRTRNPVTTCNPPASVPDNTFVPNQNTIPEMEEDHMNMAQPIRNFIIPRDMSSSSIVENGEYSGDVPQLDPVSQYPTNTMQLPPNANVNSELEMMDSLMGREVLQASFQNSSNDGGNDEAAMAVIMSLLEADAGLGGPVDFSGLPWPLP